jgi:uridine kinase
MSLALVAHQVANRPPAGSMSLRVTAIDGHGGAGKSTLANRIAHALGDAPIVHTDEFASWEEPLDWWPRLLEQVLEPLAAGKHARYQRYDWKARQLREWIDVPRGAHLVIEGVSASRLAFRPYLCFSIWVDTPRNVCLARGLARDGDDALGQWQQWIADEDRYVERETPDRHADLIVAGAPTLEHDPDHEVIVLREEPTRGAGRP